MVITADVAVFRVRAADAVFPAQVQLLLGAHAQFAHLLRVQEHRPAVLRQGNEKIAGFFASCERIWYNVDNVKNGDWNMDTKTILEMIDEKKDLCTLVTCTPYGINTHRLLVRGHRVENPEEQPVVRVSADAFMIDPVLVAPLAAVPLILLLLLLLLISSRRGTLHGRALRKAREEQRELEAAYEERNE